MTAEPNLPASLPDDVERSVARVRAELRDARAALERLTGGATPRQVLAELAQGLATDLAAHFDELPMQRFIGWASHPSRLWRWLIPKGVPHRLVLARYLQTSVPRKAGAGFVRCSARIAVLALGADGELRSGVVREWVLLPEQKQATLEALTWDDIRLRRVPSRSLVLRRWEGGTDPGQAASPSEALAALSAIASAMVASTKRDLALVERFLARAGDDEE